MTIMLLMIQEIATVGDPGLGGKIMPNVENRRVINPKMTPTILMTVNMVF